MLLLCSLGSLIQLLSALTFEGTPQSWQNSWDRGRSKQEWGERLPSMWSTWVRSPTSHRVLQGTTGVTRPCNIGTVGKRKTCTHTPHSASIAPTPKTLNLASEFAAGLRANTYPAMTEKEFPSSQLSGTVRQDAGKRFSSCKA